MKYRIALILIILAAAILRLWDCWYMEFKNDEACNSALAVDFVYKGIIPLVGDRSSQGTINPPMFVYLLSAPFFLSRNPVVASYYIAIINILAIYLCFLFCRKFFGATAALIAAAFFAVNPWAVLYSRKIWANNLLAPFIIIFFYSLHKVAIELKGKYILLSFASLAVFTQLHPSTVCYATFLIIVPVAFDSKIRPRYYLFGLACLLFLYTPYIIWNVKSNFYNLNSIVNFWKQPFVLRPDAFIMPFKLASTGGFEHSLGLSFREFVSRGFYLPILDIVQGCLAACAMAYLAFCALRRRRYIILVLWFLILVSFICFGKNYFGLAPFISLFPLQFIAIGILIDALNNRFKNLRLIRAFSLVLVGVLVMYQFLFSFSFNRFIQAKDCIYGDYGPPFKYRVAQIKEAMERGFTSAEDIHRFLLQGQRARLCYKYDFLATKYIVENMDFISR